MLEIASSSMVTIALGSSFSAIRGNRIPEWGKSAKGGMEIQAMSQERLHGGGRQGRASVTCSPDRGGMHSLIGVIDTARLRWYFSVQSKRPFKIPIPANATANENPIATELGQNARTSY